MGNFLASHCTAQAGKKIWEKNTWGTSEKRTVKQWFEAYFGCLWQKRPFLVTYSHIYQLRGKFFNHPGGQVGVIHTFATIGIVELSLFGQQFLWKPPKIMWRQFCNCSFKSNTFIYSPFSVIRALSPPTATSQISLHFLATLWSRGRQDKWDLWSRPPKSPWSRWRSG